VAVSTAPDKTALRDELARVLQADLAARERSYKAATEGATHEEARPENDKDTRALEQSYLARGEALRIEELRASLVQVQAVPVRPAGQDDPVGLGSLVFIEDEEGAEATFWLAPHGGGAKLAGGVQVVTPKSPIGRALIGARAGEACDVVLAGRQRSVTVRAVG
jgi:transcription elongation GreA/GreB family factor